MPGFQPNPLQYRVQNGNSVVILIGDQPIAFAQNVTHRFDLGAEGLYGVGSAKPQEIQQLRMSPEITLDNFALTQTGKRVIQDSVTFAAIISNNQFNITVADGLLGKVLYTYVGAVAQNFNETVAANRPLTDAISFLAMDVLDQSGQSILDGPNAYAVPSVQGTLVAGGLGVTVSAPI